MCEHDKTGSPVSFVGGQAVRGAECVGASAMGFAKRSTADPAAPIGSPLLERVHFLESNYEQLIKVLAERDDRVMRRLARLENTLGLPGIE